MPEQNKPETAPVQPTTPVQPVSSNPNIVQPNTVVKNNNKTCLIVALVVIGIIVFLSIAGFIVTAVVFKKAYDEVSKNADVAINNGNVTIKDKKTGDEYTVGSDNNGYTFKTKDGVISTTNKLPDGFPSDVPSYPGSTITGTVTGKGEVTQKPNYYVALETKDSPDKVAQYYKDKLANSGWTNVMAYPLDTLQTISGEKGDTQVGVTAMVDKDKNVTSIILYVGDKADYNTAPADITDTVQP